MSKKKWIHVKFTFCNDSNIQEKQYWIKRTVYLLGYMIVGIQQRRATVVRSRWRKIHQSSQISTSTRRKNSYLSVLADLVSFLALFYNSPLLDRMVFVWSLGNSSFPGGLRTYDRTRTGSVDSSKGDCQERESSVLWQQSRRGEVIPSFGIFFLSISDLIDSCYFFFACVSRSRFRPLVIILRLMCWCLGTPSFWVIGVLLSPGWFSFFSIRQTDPTFLAGRGILVDGSFFLHRISRLLRNRSASESEYHPLNGLDPTTHAAVIRLRQS